MKKQKYLNRSMQIRLSDKNYAEYEEKNPQQVQVIFLHSPSCPTVLEMLSEREELSKVEIKKESLYDDLCMNESDSSGEKMERNGVVKSNSDSEQFYSAQSSLIVNCVDNKQSKDDDLELEPLTVPETYLKTWMSTRQIIVEGKQAIAFWDESLLYNLDSGLASDMRLAQISIIALVYSNQAEFKSILNRSSGILGYLRKYWTGFFPLLSVQSCSGQEDFQITEDDIKEMIHSQFSSYHQIVLNTDEGPQFLIESILNYKTHLCICDRYKSVQKNSRWKCDGPCGLKTSNIIEEEKRTKSRNIFFKLKQRVQH